MAKVILLLVLLLASCAVDGDGDPCRELWVDCPGVASDYQVCAGASDLEEETAGGVRYFSYYNCALGRRTQTLNIPAECVLEWK